MRVSAILVRIALFVALPLVTACAGSAQVADTEEGRQELARTIARLSAQSGNLRDMIDHGAELAQASTAESLKLEIMRELTDDEEARVLEIFKKALADILTQQEYEGIMTEVVAGSFTAPEMAEALAFYRSPTGAKILQLEATLSKEIDAKTDALFEKHLDEFIARVDRELNAQFEELHEGDGQ